ncbi:MAG: hypothetical protein WC969_05420 [Elusimicrobiota bacterium]
MSLLLLLLLAAAPARAVPASFELSPATTTVLLGAPFDVTGTARLPEGSRLALALQGNATGAYEILEVRVEPAPPEGGSAVFRLRLKAAAFELGETALPALPWTVVPAAGAPEEVLSPPVRLSVIPPQSFTQAPEMHDIREPLSPALWPWLLILLALGSLVGWLWERRRRRKGGSGADAAGGAPDLRTPEQFALDELDLLPGLGLPPKDHYDRMSDIVRAYLEKRYGLPALRMTTYDLLRALRPVDPPSVRAVAKNLFERCDLAKFARYAPEERERTLDLENAREIVRQASRQAFAERLAAPPPGGAA